MSMTGPVCLISVRRLEALEMSRRRLKCTAWVLGGLAIALGVGAAGWPIKVRVSSAVRVAEASTGEILHGGRAPLPAAKDSVYDQFLQEYAPLRADGEWRRYLADQVLVAAAAHQVDPDLLFALIAAESGFDNAAVSPKGARGLGQMQFATARAVAPGAVRQPEDLHDVPRNLHATALHLRQLLGEGRGDLRRALRAYVAGAWPRKGLGRGGDQYVARVSTHYAYLKARRTHLDLSAVAAGGTTAGSPVN